MAEAYSFQNIGKEFKRGGHVSITDEGVHFSFNVTIPRMSVLKVILKRRAKRWVNFWIDSIYPWGPVTFILCASVAIGNAMFS